MFNLKKRLSVFVLALLVIFAPLMMAVPSLAAEYVNDDRYIRYGNLELPYFDLLDSCDVFFVGLGNDFVWLVPVADDQVISVRSDSPYHFLETASGVYPFYELRNDEWVFVSEYTASHNLFARNHLGYYGLSASFFDPLLFDYFTEVLVLSSDDPDLPFVNPFGDASTSYSVFGGYEFSSGSNTYHIDEPVYLDGVEVSQLPGLCVIGHFVSDNADCIELTYIPDDPFCAAVVESSYHPGAYYVQLWYSSDPKVYYWVYDNGNWIPYFWDDFPYYDITSAAVLNWPDNLRLEHADLLPLTGVSTGRVVDASSPFAGIFSVFSGVACWLAASFGNVSTIFWTADGGVTVLGVLVVASLAISVILLLVALVAGWLKF